MQALKLIVPGQYWDSQIYQGRLYLFLLDGGLFAVDWDKIIADYAEKTSQQFAFACAFQRSDYLYGSKWQLFFGDSEVTNLIRGKFDRLAAQPLEIPRAVLERYRGMARPNPMPFPHADCTIYGQQMYVSSPSGVFRSTCNKRTVGPISGRPAQICDIPVNAVSAGWNTLAMAAGSDGLWQYSLGPSADYARDPGKLDERLTQLSEVSCAACNWNYYSIYCSSYETGGYLADFSVAYADETPKESSEVSELFGRDIPFDGHRERIRQFEEVIPADAIFQSKAYSWGCRDKICQATATGIKVVRYTPWAKTREERIRPLGGDLLPTDFGEPIAGSVALFGTVIEYENGLFVLASNGERFDIPGEPVNWRTFPRSVQYANHLHVVYDDRLEILSFNHDYFVDQPHKIMGIQGQDL